MSEPERLREAARLMREQHGPEHERHHMWSALADLLDDAAVTAEFWGSTGQPGSHVSLTAAVARAYLAAAPAPAGDSGGERG